jgi:hypothetical protein
VQRNALGTRQAGARRLTPSFRSSSNNLCSISSERVEHIARSHADLIDSRPTFPISELVVSVRSIGWDEKMRSKLIWAALLISSSANAGEAMGRHMEAAFDLVATMSPSCEQHYEDGLTFEGGGGIAIFAG